MKHVLISFATALLVVAIAFALRSEREDIERLERANKLLDQRVYRLEQLILKPKAESAKPVAMPSPAPASAPAVAKPAPTPAPEPVSPSEPRPDDLLWKGQIVDRPADRETCSFASINSHTNLAETMTWGGGFIGELPQGSIVEILSAETPLWTDFPNEHGLHVRVVESSNHRIEGQSGYIEMRRIGFKRCNIGAQFEM